MHSALNKVARVISSQPKWVQVCALSLIVALTVIEMEQFGASIGKAIYRVSH
jgi:hypothetical protein